MGLLDDAIREHLDLKRRRGADPAEVERAEREALGPVRRAPTETAEAEPRLEDEHASEQDEVLPAYDHEDEQDWADPFEEHDPPSAMPISEPDQRGLDEPTAVHEAATPAPSRSPLEPDDDDPFAAEEERDRLAPNDHTDPPADATAAEGGAEATRAVPAPHPAPPSPSPPRQPSEHVGQETAEYHVEDALEEERKDGEDPLEETPEFLQDTPEHDRLWFEQRPPRDFDFEG